MGAWGPIRIHTHSGTNIHSKIVPIPDTILLPLRQDLRECLVARSHISTQSCPYSSTFFELDSDFPIDRYPNNIMHPSPDLDINRFLATRRNTWVR